ncbi:MAG: TadE/TadG family type IV pilus assembly protein, partial [Nocardioides sp.]
MTIHDQRGSASIEATIGLPAFVLFVGLIIFGGRTSVAHQAV